MIENLETYGAWIVCGLILLLVFHKAGYWHGYSQGYKHVNEDLDCAFSVADDRLHEARMAEAVWLRSIVNRGLQSPPSLPPHPPIGADEYNWYILRKKNYKPEDTKIYYCFISDEYVEMDDASIFTEFQINKVKRKNPDDDFVPIT